MVGKCIQSKCNLVEWQSKNECRLIKMMITMTTKLTVGNVGEKFWVTLKGALFNLLLHGKIGAYDHKCWLDYDD